MTERRCGDCTLCCKLLPVREMNKRAGERCQHQRHTGCAVYRKPGMPMSCSMWSCRWVVNDDTGELRRPDRSHYVIDMMPDFVTVVDDETGERTPLEVVQVWVDPKHRDAWQDPALLDYLARRGEEGKAALIRYSNREGITVIPPAMTSDGQFLVKEPRDGALAEKTHSFAEVATAIANAPKRVRFG